MTKASGPEWLLNRHGVPQRVRQFLPAHHPKIIKTNCEKLEPILSTCRPRLRTAEAGASTQTRQYLDPVVMALLHLSSFLSLQLAIVQLPAVTPELCRSASVARASAFCTISFNSFSTFRADHDTSMSFTRPDHTTPVPFQGSATVDEFLQHKCCGSCDMPFSGTRTE